MNDKEKLNALYSNLKNVIIPRFSSPALQVIANTVEIGLTFICDWVKSEGRKEIDK